MTDYPRKPILQVALPLPLRRLFDYRCNETIPKLGARVLVPFGKRQLVGVVLFYSHCSGVDSQKLRNIESALDEVEVLDEKMRELCQWVARYYQYPVGEVLSQALPVLLRKGEASHLSHLFWSLQRPLSEKILLKLRKAPKKTQIIKLLAEHPKGLSEDMLIQLGFKRALLRALEEKGYLFSRSQEPVQPDFNEFHPQVKEPPLLLNYEQQVCLEKMASSLEQFQTFLLDGVTGSGKTEVYLQLVEQALAKGLQVLVLVPEIGLAPQILERFERRFLTPVSVLHSAMSDRDRLHSWWCAKNAKVGVVIGTRSAVFTPLPRLGLIIVDEEHDSSYKQQDNGRYHGRDVAIWRARQRNVPIILGSATPSLESFYNCEAKKYHYLSLTERAGKAQPPQFKLLDIRAQAMQNGLSLAAIEAMKVHLELGRQVLVFLNRRGFAPTLLCQACGWVANCDHCDSPLTLHRKPYHLRCHYCDYRQAVPASCTNCQSAELAPIGQGTERSEEVINAYFPETQVVRIDRDSTRQKNAMDKLLQPVRQGLPCILLGTQMLAKGHHFPFVTLVVVVNADQGLFSSDFRGLEKVGQLLVQVGGRSGRAENPGEVLVQTANPDHESLQTLLTKGYSIFAKEQLQTRQQMDLPPFTCLALLKAEALDWQLAQNFLTQVRESFSQDFQSLQVVGPLPAQMERLKGRYRAFLLFKSDSRKSLAGLLTRLALYLENLPKGHQIRWSIDVDPQELL